MTVSHLSGFTRVNGIKQGDGLYEVEVQYTVTVTPDSNQWSQVKEWGQDKKDFVTALKEQNALRQQLTQAGNTVFTDVPEYQAADQKVLDIQQKISEGYSPAKMLNDMTRTCPNTPVALFTDYIYKSKVNEDGVSKLSYSRTLSMVKTDNGWQENR